jgi:hypothetical protein
MAEDAVHIEDSSFVQPADPPADANEYEKESWKKQLDLFLEKESNLYGQQNETIKFSLGRIIKNNTK